MTTPMYKYIKGKEVLTDEHMLSATELAKLYGLLTMNNNPNGLLVCHLLADYIRDNNLNISDYYYPHSHGVMKVYPAFVYNPALSGFVFKLEEDKEYFYITRDSSKRSKIKYKYKQPKENGTIILINERGKYHGSKC